MAYYDRGVAFDEKREYDKAIADFTKTVHLNPKYSPAYRIRGTVYSQMGEHDKAIADLTEFVRLNPKLADSYYCRGHAYSEKGEHAKAIADYTEAIRLDPKLAAAYSNRGVEYTNREDYDNAISDCTQAIQYDPTNVIPYLNRAFAYSKKADFDKVIADCTQAVRLDPKNVTTYLNRALAYSTKGDFDKSIADYTTAIRLNPKIADAYYCRGFAYEKKGDKSKAEEDFAQAKRLGYKLKELTVDLGNGVKLEMVLIPAGEFMMGSPDSDKDAIRVEKPQHRVRITKPFYLGKYLVTQEQWDAVMGKGHNPSRYSRGPKKPVESLRWDDCQVFLSKLNAKTCGQGGKFVLPTEAQWEYACRAGSKTRYYFGDDESQLGEYAWYAANSGSTSHEVGGKKPNAWGLYDMHGNVWEWCADWYDPEYYGKSPMDDPTGPTTGSNHVYRGGSWLPGSSPRYCRSAHRLNYRSGDFLLGLRVAQVPADKETKMSGAVKGGASEPKTNTEANPEPKAQPKVKPLPKREVDLCNGVKLELVLIPAGEFMMGSPDSDKDAAPNEKPQHRVRITKPFYLGKYLVTQEQWEAVMGSNPSQLKGPKNPVEKVSWEDCQQFLGKLNAKSAVGGGKFQLPSEAQWEYACRAGSTTKYCFGDDESKLGEYAWYNAKSGNTPVGEKKPNAWGLYDVHGNVWEWCQDWWKDGYYKESPVDDPRGPTGGSRRVLRGGGWHLVARDCRSALRGWSLPGIRSYDLGFRVCQMESVLEPQQAASPATSEATYDRKSFEEWRKELETELKAERQVEAIKAFAAFGNRGYNKEATEAILSVMRKIPYQRRYDRRQGVEGQIGAAAIAAFAGRKLPNAERVGFIDPKIAEPILLKETREENCNGRLFAASALGAMGQSAESALASLEESARGEKDREVREAVILSVFSIDQSGERIVSLLRELVREKDPQMLGAVLSTRTSPQIRLVTDLQRVVWENRTTIKSRHWSPKGRAVLRFLTELVESPDTAIRGVAFDQIGALEVDGQDVVPALIQAFRQRTDDDRGRIADALVRIGKPAMPAVPVLEKSIQQINDQNVRKRLESQLRPIGSYLRRMIGVRR
jgi:formylglycine-generating enzyme required for sulfatase activity/Tfp pilus assembly protein PilF